MEHDLTLYVAWSLEAGVSAFGQRQCDCVVRQVKIKKKINPIRPLAMPFLPF